MRTWQEVTHREPCPVCHKPDWCSRSLDGVWTLCRRVETGEGLHRVDKAGGEYWLYPQGGSSPASRQTDEIPAPHPVQCADAPTRDAVYRALLGALRLSPVHHQALSRRGLPEAELERRYYRTLPLKGRAALARRLVEHFGADTRAQIPGLYVAEAGGRCW